MAELDLRREARGARANAPGDHWLCDPAGLDRLDEVVLVRAADLAEQKKDLGARVVLVPEEVVEEAAARVPVAANGNALVDAIRVAADDVVQLVGHAPGLGDVGNGAGAVQAGHHDVVKHATRVADAEAARLDAAHGRRPDNADLLRLRRLDEFLGLLLGHALGNDGHSLDLRVLHRLHGRLVHRPEGGKVDEHRRAGMPLACLLGRRVHRHQGLLGPPVELDVVVPAEGEDHRLHGGLLPLAHVVEVEHALHRAVLHAVHYRCRLRRGRHDGVLGGRGGRLHDGGLRAGCRDQRALRRPAGLAQVRLRQRVDEAESHGDDGRDVRLGAVDLDPQAKLVAGGLGLAQALNVVGAGTADHNLDLVLLDVVGVVLQRLDEAGEGGRDVREVRDAAADDEVLAVRMLVLHHERQEGLGIGEGLLCGGRPGVLAIVRKFMAHAVVGDGVGIDNRSTTAGHHCPDAALLVQDGELQRGTGLAVHVTDECLFGVGGTAEGRRPVHLAPLLRAEEVPRLVKLGGHVQGHDGAVLEHDEGIDLEVGEVEVLVELEEGHHEGGEVGLLVSGNLAEKLVRHRARLQGLAHSDLQVLRL
mmetsp:Transcript_46225/g.142995  ORF Transcript_46225/g.142995 Transcript_46225/m.142995 type:complete len:588 (-) Transcript_46225:519-2282(-)